jgi:adenylate cyclase
LGDNVNLASRLESLNKFYGTSLLVSDTCYEEIKERLPCRLVDFVSVKGKTEGIKVYEIMSDSDSNYAYEFTTVMNEYFYKKDFKKAENKFMQLQKEKQNDKVCELMIKRCREYIENPPPSDWTGVRHLNQK